MERKAKNESGRILYARLPGLLVRAARRQRNPDHAFAVTCQRAVRDADPIAQHHGVVAGMSLSAARRLCPTLLAVPFDAVDARRETTAFLDRLADLSPVVEPAGAEHPEVAWADLSGLGRSDAEVRAALGEATVGIGPGRVAARALAECALPPERLADASSAWLWPEDAAVAARLHRLGLTTFGQVAALPESAVLFQFGAKVGRLLWRRARGQDLSPLQALYPPPVAETRIDCSLAPLVTVSDVDAVLEQACQTLSRDLAGRSQWARRLRLEMQDEDGRTLSAEAMLPVPVQEANAIESAVCGRLRPHLPRVQSGIAFLSLRALDLERAASVTVNLFDERGVGSASAELASVRRSLALRFGPQIVTLGRDWPLSARDIRRALLQ